MPNKKISELAVAGALSGSELVEVVQGGQNVQTTTQYIADLGVGGGTWGSITGTLSDQADLQAALDAKSVKYEHFAVSDETTGLTTGTGKVSFRMPYGATLIAVRASLVAPQTSGSIFTVDINKNGTTVLSTKLTIDNNEKTSATAATPPVISVSSFTDDDEVTVDIDQIGNGTAAGLKIKMYFS